MQRWHALLLLALASTALAAGVLGDAATDNSAAGADDAPFDMEAVVTELKRKEDKRDEAVATIDDMQALLTRWKGVLQNGDEERSAPEDDVNYDLDVELVINTTKLPERCSRVSGPGDYLRIHYIGKLLATDKIFDSSFHTGSMPVKIQLGSESNLQGWNEGLQGMCEGERRTISFPARMGYGATAHKGVPKNAALKYHVELVELSGGRRVEGAATGDDVQTPTKRKKKRRRKGRSTEL